ncbi:WecB/TagA/CpsF family glycosyltransferase [Brevundimonas faecalis]|uniref:N-acetylglucosaminyldiphosphoundecaprenol N-acetyl-beta-D-mannosaminyltransferase n=1 Tax=Brevundimonas faecalis TaxID=947378 RepID=A0ABV2R8L3_9CAUL
MYQEPHGVDQAKAAPDRRARERRPFRQQRRPEERVRILGEIVDLMRPEEVLLHVERCVEAGRRSVVANHNLHSLYLLPRTPGMRRIYDLADVVELDSTPLIHFARLLGLHSRPFHRCTYLDWRAHFWSLADRKGWRVLYVGGADGVAEQAAARVSQRYPGAVLKGMTGYFDATPGSAGNEAVLAEVRDFRPDILFVGMGMPRQELWIADNIEALPNAVILPVGAAFDYEAGVQKAAPRWMGRMGVEWLFRLFADPKRLYARYCVEPWFLIGPALKDVREAWARRKKKRS